MDKLHVLLRGSGKVNFFLESKMYVEFPLAAVEIKWIKHLKYCNKNETRIKYIKYSWKFEKQDKKGNDIWSMRKIRKFYFSL